jgi:serine protease
MHGSRSTVIAFVVVLSAAASAQIAPATALDAPASVRTIAPAVAHAVTPHRHLYSTVGDAVARRARSSSRFNSASTFVGPNLTYQGGTDGIGVTTGPPQVYVVFWGSQWGTANPPGSTTFSNDAAGMAPRVVALLSGIGTNNELWSGVMTQYCEGVPIGTTICPVPAPHVGYPVGGALAGVWADTSIAAPVNASATQIGDVALNAAAHFGNTTAASNRNAQYVVVSPTGTHPDGFNAGAHFCAWHDGLTSNTSPASPYGDIAYTNLPYVPDMGPSCGKDFVNPSPAGDLDGVTIVEGHEYAETITDQLPAGGWIDQGRNETGDKCAWMSTGSGRSQDVAFATGSFAMQSTWSNDGRACEIAHAVWGLPGLPDDFSLDEEPPSAFVQAGNDATTQITSATVTGNPQTITWSATDLPPDATAAFSPATMPSDGTTTATISTAPTTPDGEYHVTLTATGSTTHSQTFLLVVGPVPPTLQNGVAVTGLSGAAGSDQYFQIPIPDGTSEADFTLTAPVNGANISVVQDILPTDDDYFCAWKNPSVTESCHFFDVSGNWFIRVHGVVAFSGVTLVVTYGFASRLFAGEVMTGISGSAGSVHYFWIHVLSAKAKKLSIKIGGFTGDANLYGRLGSLPSQWTDVCGKQKIGRRSESCTISHPVPGYWYFSVYGVTDYANLKLRARVS